MATKWHRFDDPKHLPPKDGVARFLGATWIAGDRRWKVVVRVWQPWYADRDGPPFELWAAFDAPPLPAPGA